MQRFKSITNFLKKGQAKPQNEQASIAVEGPSAATTANQNKITYFCTITLHLKFVFVSSQFELELTVCPWRKKLNWTIFVFILKMNNMRINECECCQFI